MVKHTFTFLWLVGVGTSCAAVSGALHGYSEIADTKHCVRTSGWAALSVLLSSPVLFDTLVYVAITYKILSTHRTSRQGYWRDFCCGKALPHLSRAVFQGGQQYYL